MRKILSVCLAVLYLSALALGQDEPKRGPSTAEERKRFVAVARRMEEAPLDKSFLKERNWALHWLIDIPDINVNPCNNEIFGNFTRSRYRFVPEILGQFSFSMAAFMIEHPDKAKDQLAVNTAGLEGALKAYRAILRVEPDAQSRTLEQMADKQSEGKLIDYVREAIKNGCNTEGDQKGL